MPREYVYGAHWPDTDPKEWGENTPFQMCASIGWSREDAGGGVQLATVRNGAEHSFDSEDGLYMDLDRRGINELIRLLRKARDQAFGRDE
jgi:hypothetical protein